MRGYPRPGNVVTRSPLPLSAPPPLQPGGSGKAGRARLRRGRGRMAGHAPVFAPPLTPAPPLVRRLRSSPCCSPAHRPPSRSAPSSSLRPHALAPPLGRAPPPPRSALRGRHFSSRLLKFGGNGDRILLWAVVRPLWRPHASCSHARFRFLSFLAPPPQSAVPGSGATAPGPPPPSPPPPPPPGSNGNDSGGLGRCAAGP